jgi:peptidylprolyl isomerase
MSAVKYLLAISFVAMLFACGGSTEKPVAGPRAPIQEVQPRADRQEPVDRKALAIAPVSADHSDTGLAWQVLFPGSGSEHPGRYSTVRVHYTGWTSDGRVFDSSRTRGRPAEFVLDQVIAGWTEGVQLMVVGEERRFWIPAELAYGRDARPGAPEGDLTFDVELLAILFTPNVPSVPADVAEPGADAVRTPSGLAYKTLVEGDGKHPKRGDMVRIDFTGWSTSGTMFETTLAKRDGQSVFILGHAMKGWLEGIQLMRVGGTTRFWIPPNLALGDNPPPPHPKGTMVFDVYLAGIEDQ